MSDRFSIKSAWFGRRLIAAQGLMCLIMFSLSMLLMAQESESLEQETTETAEPSSEHKSDADQASSAGTTPTPSNPTVNPDASFTPTEEISEDQPVAFPVDI